MEEKLTKMEKPELCAVFLASAEDRTGQEAKLQAENIVHTYTSESLCPERVLLLATAILEEDQFAHFVDSVAIKVLSKLSNTNIQYIIRIIMKLPKDEYQKIASLTNRCASIPPPVTTSER